MATTPPDQTVRTNERLWSDEVGLTVANEGPIKPHPVYEWSNGKTHSDGHGPYSNHATEDPEA